MKNIAYVKTTNGNFPNVNFYLAWKGFVELGYDVIKFDDCFNSDNFSMFKQSCNRYTPVFAGVSVFRSILNSLNVKYNEIDCYPELLYPFLNRSIQKSTLGEYKKLWEASEDNLPVKFIKPVNHKEFNGKVMKSILDWFPLINVPLESEIYICSPLKFLSEFRVYIRDGHILAGKHYNGDWSKMIDENVVKSAIQEFKPIAPIAYALDFGVTSDGKTTLIEYNDATSLGNYGLPAMHYAEMLLSRWSEIWQNGKE